MQLTADFASTQSTTGQLEYLHFAVSQKVGNGITHGLFGGQTSQHGRSSPLVEINPSGQNTSNGEQNIAGGLLFGDITLCAGTQDAFGIQSFIMHGDNQDQ